MKITITGILEEDLIYRTITDKFSEKEISIAEFYISPHSFDLEEADGGIAISSNKKMGEYKILCRFNSKDALFVEEEFKKGDLITLEGKIYTYDDVLRLVVRKARKPNK